MEKVQIRLIGLWVFFVFLILIVGSIFCFRDFFFSKREKPNPFWSETGVFVYSGSVVSSGTGWEVFFTGARAIADIKSVYSTKSLTASGNGEFFYGEYPEFVHLHDERMKRFVENLSENFPKTVSNSWEAESRTYISATYDRLFGNGIGSIVYTITEEHADFSRQYPQIFLVNRYGAIFSPKDLLKVYTDEEKNAFSGLLRSEMEKSGLSGSISSEGYVAGFFENPEFAFSGETAVFYFPVSWQGESKRLPFFSVPYEQLENFIERNVSYSVTPKNTDFSHGKKYVALTFDDGPNGKTTPMLLDILKEKGVHATFFVIGSNAEKYPDIISRTVHEWHVIGNHTFTHPELVKLDTETLQYQVFHTDEIIRWAWSGYVTEIFRPTYGAYNETVRENVTLPLVNWSIDTNDWKTRNTKRSIDTALGNLHEGAIILFHDIYPESVAAIAPVIDGLRARWYEPVTVPELYALYHHGESMKPGQVCFSASNCR